MNGQKGPAFPQGSSKLEKISQDGWGFVAQAIAASPIQPVATLHLGSFGFETPAFVREAAKRALDRPECNQYSPPNGRKTLRDALATMYTPFLGWEINPETEICVTTGANEGILSAITAFIDPGDEVLIFEPFYDQFPHNVKLVGGTPVFVPLTLRSSGVASPSSARDWQVDLSELEKATTSRTKMIILNSPQNPTGKVFSQEELQIIGDFCVKHDLFIVSDEVYEHMCFEGSFTRMASINEEIRRRTITAGSAGKSFFLTGWRVGWMIGPESLIAQVARAHTAICFSTVSPFQEAVAEALADSSTCLDFWKRSNQDMSKRMEKFNSIWPELGLKFYTPQGAYFVIVDMSGLRIPETYKPPAKFGSVPRDCHIAWFLTVAIGVAAIPCSTFTTANSQALPEGMVRFSFGKTFQDLEIAMDRLRKLREYL